MSQESKNAPPGLLEGRPEAKAIKIEDLLKHVHQGRVRIPSFQRPLKWAKKEALELMDSIYRGYPVGTLLFWETDGEPFELMLGKVRVSGGQRADAWWIVDGQQRVTSLARVLLARPEDADDFAMVFDLDEGVFQSLGKINSSDPSRWLPLTEVLDSERLMQWAFKHAQGDAGNRRERAFQLGKRIREYEITVYVVHNGSPEILREIFGRMNSAGKSLESHEVFDALNGSKSSEKPSSISQIASSLIDLGFGVVEEKILYRLLRVLRGEDVTERAGPLRLRPEQVQEAYMDAAKAAGRVIQFLKSEAGLPNYDLMPYKQPFVTLGKFFFYHPDPSERSKELLIRWLWRGALNGSHRGDTVSTRRVLDVIDPTDEHTSVQGMLSSVKIKSYDEYTYDPGMPFNFRHASAKLQVLAMADLKPRDLSTGEALDVTKLFFDADKVHGLPLPQMVAAPSSIDGLWASAANRFLHPAHPGLRKELLAVKDKAILASHGVTEEAYQALVGGRGLDFLKERQKSLHVHFKVFFDRNARWAEVDRPPLHSLIVSDGD